jgi:glycosyltransferase involved in cell wall biosynthesis
MNNKKFIELLYKKLLNRDADDGGLKNYLLEMEGGADPMSIFESIANSNERFAIENEFLSACDDGYIKAFNNKNKYIKNHIYDLEYILKSSRKFFNNTDFFKNLSNVKNIFLNKNSEIKNIAIYYWRMNNGGTERVTSLQIKLFCRMGYNVILITDTEEDSLLDYDYGNNVIRYVIPRRMMDNEDYVPRGQALADILKHEKIDLYITNQWYEISSVWDTLVSKSLGIPVILGWHNSLDAGIHNVDDIQKSCIRFYGYKHIDLIYVLSESDRLWFNFLNIPSRLIHNPLTFESSFEKHSPNNNKNIIWIGRVEKHQKRIDHAIQIFHKSLINDRELTLTVVGDGPDLEWAKNYSESLGIRGSIIFTGYTNDVSKYIEKASIHLMTSEFEGYPMVLGEVWSHGVPSVLYNLDHLEFLRHGMGFVAIDIGDTNKASIVLTEICNNQKLLDRLSTDALFISKQIFEKNDQALVWSSIISQLSNGIPFKIEDWRAADIPQLKVLTKKLSRTLFSFNKNNYSELNTFDVNLGCNEDPSPKIKNKSSKSKWNGLFFSSNRIRMIDLSNVGLGDNLMIWAGLYALMDNNIPILAENCILHTQPLLLTLCDSIFSKYGIEVKAGKPSKQISPLFDPLPPRGFKQIFETYLGNDWRMNWVDATDLQKSFPRPHVNNKGFKTLINTLSEWFLYKRTTWKSASPTFIGLRIWYPIALKHGITPFNFLSMIKRSIVGLRLEVNKFIESNTLQSDLDKYRLNSVFPVGKSFQTIPPVVCKQICDKFQSLDFKIFIQNDTPWYDDYLKNGANPISIKDFMDTLRIVKYSDILITTDSFTSHLAQLMRDDFILILSRDFRENIVHPGASPRVFSNHPECAPCNYVERYHSDRCVAGYHYCTAFHSTYFINSIIKGINETSLIL